jgi:hypothetical protein
MEAKEKGGPMKADKFLFRRRDSIDRLLHQPAKNPNLRTHLIMARE